MWFDNAHLCLGQTEEAPPTSTDLAKCSSKASVSTNLQSCLGVDGKSRYPGDASEKQISSEAFAMFAGMMREVADSATGVTFVDQLFSCYLLGVEAASGLPMFMPYAGFNPDLNWGDPSTFPNPPPCADANTCEAYEGHNAIVSIPGSEDDNKVVVMGAHWDTVVRYPPPPVVVAAADRILLPALAFI